MTRQPSIDGLEAGLTDLHLRIDTLSKATGAVADTVHRLHLRVATLHRRVDELSGSVEPPEPEPDLDATIRSLHESNDGLRNLLEDAKRTERDLDAEVVELQKENRRLTQLAWQAVQDKQGAEAVAKTLSEELAQRTLERDDLKRRLEFECGERAALMQSVTEQRRALLSILGIED
jgi:chromosome segregation ATPase